MNADQLRPKAGCLAAIACLLASLAALAAPAGTQAAPVVTLDPVAAPIPENLLMPKDGSFWPNTGNQAGEPAELEAHFTILGSEYEGLPAPLRHIALYLPKGIVIHTSGFGRCKHSALVPRKTPPCPIRSLAGAASPEMAMVSIGGTGAPSEWEQGAFFPASGTLGFWSHTTSGPFTGGGYSSGSLVPITGTYGYKMTESLPVRATILGSTSTFETTALDFTLGAAYRQGHDLISVVTLPHTCPTGGWPVKAELSFGVGDEATWESTSATAVMRCKG